MSQNPSSPSFRLRSPGVKLLFDPQTQPVVASPAVLQPLPDSALEADFIAKAFDRRIEWQVEPVFAKDFLVHRDPDTGLLLPDHSAMIPAAVLFPLIQRESGLHVLFTRRADHLTSHAGQICFPGGRIELHDADVKAAALRETHEEVGIGAEHIQLIGTQPGFITSTGYTMQPVIGLVKPGFVIRPDHSEVAEVFEVPLSYLMDPRQHQLHQATLPDGRQRLYFSMPWNDYFIWGATAALVRNFYHYLSAAHQQR
ncbi:MAG TPA: CoA pyrophosphatase [Pusillimonas sp.]|nr:CoA pyrophosphatase [Pusillimonas sp.]HCN70324.1 CoA pyrophosphatase [Pusillimonas sp.]|tara:strand:+ start:128577 stop:129341 length:765 start_codon:yes stop_codon:yes gene_type:complete